MKQADLINAMRSATKQVQEWSPQTKKLHAVKLKADAYLAAQKRAATEVYADPRMK